jgi:hypothetical protein
VNQRPRWQGGSFSGVERMEFRRSRLTGKAVFDPQVVWHNPGQGPITGEHRGVDAVLGFHVADGKISEVWEQHENTATADALWN